MLPVNSASRNERWFTVEIGKNLLMKHYHETAKYHRLPHVINIIFFSTDIPQLYPNPPNQNGTVPKVEIMRREHCIRQIQPSEGRYEIVRSGMARAC